MMLKICLRKCAFQVLLREIFLLNAKINEKEKRWEESDTPPGSKIEFCSEDGLSQDGRQTPWWCKTIFDQVRLGSAWFRIMVVSGALPRETTPMFATF